EEEGIFNRETGQSFLDNILTRGGSEEPMELFKRFRGREPQLDKAFVTERLINWSLSDTTTRLVIRLGVAYGSDLEKVKRVLLQA
ncbi:M3 family metallopeptidase, partial [Salmonella enterica subsp. enterica serovar Anatum]|nr:M3 family metallopeptidase [Salmonella enterica subsp. enterica serovar Anatum]